MNFMESYTIVQDKCLRHAYHMQVISTRYEWFRVEWNHLGTLGLSLNQSFQELHNIKCAFGFRLKLAFCFKFSVICESHVSPVAKKFIFQLRQHIYSHVTLLFLIKKPRLGPGIVYESLSIFSSHFLLLFPCAVHQLLLLSMLQSCLIKCLREIWLLF